MVARSAWPAAGEAELIPGLEHPAAERPPDVVGVEARVAAEGHRRRAVEGPPRLRLGTRARVGGAMGPRRCAPTPPLISDRE